MAVQQCQVFCSENLTLLYCRIYCYF